MWWGVQAGLKLGQKHGLLVAHDLFERQTAFEKLKRNKGIGRFENQRINTRRRGHRNPQIHVQWFRRWSAYPQNQKNIILQQINGQETHSGRTGTLWKSEGDNEIGLQPIHENNPRFPTERPWIILRTIREFI